MINNFINKPLVKICATVIIIYFALFANKENPDSLGNKITKEKLQENFSEAKKQSRFIMKHINDAQSLAEVRKKRQEDNVDYEQKKIECGDVVYLDYVISKAEQKIHSANNAKFIVGKKENVTLEQNIIGLKQGESKEIEILSLSQDKETQGLKYLVTIQKITSENNNIEIYCR